MKVLRFGKILMLGVYILIKHLSVKSFEKSIIVEDFLLRPT